MAVIAKQPEGTRTTLLSRHLVGRSRQADLHMTGPTVSGEHAVLRWTGREWELHDLGSRNGTLVDGRRLAAGERVALARGATIAFGQADNAWQLIDDTPPTIIAVRDDNEPVCGGNDLLALPSEDNPEAVIYRDSNGDWVIEQAGESAKITDRRTIRVAGRDYMLRVPDLIPVTWDNSSPSAHLATLTFRFSVSRDEEYIALTARDDHHTIDLGARAHHAVLLTLARNRLEDRKARAAASDGKERPLETSEGWMFQDELADKLAMDEPHLNVAVFRCRRQLAEAGITGAASVIERRRPTREVRLGVSQIEIVSV